MSASSRGYRGSGSTIGYSRGRGEADEHNAPQQWQYPDETEHLAKSTGKPGCRFTFLLEARELRRSTSRNLRGIPSRTNGLLSRLTGAILGLYVASRHYHKVKKAKWS